MDYAIHRQYFLPVTNLMMYARSDRGAGFRSACSKRLRDGDVPKTCGQPKEGRPQRVPRRAREARIADGENPQHDRDPKTVKDELIGTPIDRSARYHWASPTPLLTCRHLDLGIPWLPPPLD